MFVTPEQITAANQTNLEAIKSASSKAYTGLENG